MLPHIRDYQNETGTHITPRRRAAIVSYRMLPLPLSFRQIESLTGVHFATANRIFKRAVTNVSQQKAEMLLETLEEEMKRLHIFQYVLPKYVNDTDKNLLVSVKPTPPSISIKPTISSNSVKLHEVLDATCLDSTKAKGRPIILDEERINQLIAFIKSGFKTRRMPLRDIRRELGWHDISDSTLYRALQSRGVKSYHEQFKFILSPENKAIRLLYCQDRETWTVGKGKDWDNYGFTDEMSIEIGGLHGIYRVWREEDEEWHQDCIGAKKKQGATVMCWGMIGWNMKGPFFVWDPETKEEKESARAEIQTINEETSKRMEELNTAWKASEDYRLLKEYELAEARRLRAEAKISGIKIKTTQSWRGVKHKVNKIKRGNNCGVDSWRYVNCLARPILWPKCKELLQVNPNFVLMEDNAPSHSSNYTTEERLKHGIPKVQWPPNSPDLNPIERIWALLKRRIQKRRSSERITTVNAMKAALQEEWERLTIEEINAEIAKLPKIVDRCITVRGGNNFHA